MIFLSFHLSSCISYLFRSCWAVCLVKSWLTRCSFRFPHAATIKRRSGGGERTERCRKRRKDDRNAELITAPQRERKCVRGHLCMTSANILKIVLTPTSSLSAICLLFVLKFQIVLPPPTFCENVTSGWPAGDYADCVHLHQDIQRREGLRQNVLKLDRTAIFYKCRTTFYVPWSWKRLQVSKSIT